MPDPTIPEAAVDAILTEYPPDQFPDIACNVHGILTAAAPHILLWAAGQIGAEEGMSTSGDTHAEVTSWCVRRFVEDRFGQKPTDA